MSPWSILWQLALGLFLVAVSISLSVVIVRESVAGLVERLGRLERDHRDLTRRVQARTPSFVAVAGLVGQIVLQVAGGAFGEDAAGTLVVSSALTLALWVCNELMLADAPRARRAGWGLYFVTLLALPAFVMVHDSPAGLLQRFWDLDLRVKLFWLFLLIALFVAPFVTHGNPSRPGAPARATASSRA